MIRLLVILGVLCLPALCIAQANEPLPTMQELQQLYDTQEWSPLLQKISRVLALRGAAAQPYDRYEVLLMKGEAQLNLKQASAAASTFSEAAKEASANPDRAAFAEATAAVIRKAPGGTYTRKSPTSQPSDPKTFDVLDRSKRKEVFAAFAADEVAILTPKAKSATSASNLRPVIEILKSIDDLKSAEIASTGATPLTAELVAPLAEHSKALGDKAVLSQKTQVDNIERAANQVVEVSGDRPSGYAPNPNRYVRKVYKKRGLMGTDTQTLKRIIQECNQIASGMKEMAEAFGDSGKSLNDVAGDATKLADRAKVVLDTDYTVTSSDPRGPR